LVFNWDGVEELFPEGLLDDMFEAYCRLLRRLADEEDVWQETRQQLVPVPATQLKQRAAVNAAQTPISAELLHTLFAAQVKQQPEQEAVVSSTQRLTYEELYHRSNHVGHWLRERGARTNKLVAVVMEKGWEQVVAVLGVLQSGAAYLPIAADLPEERIWYLLENGEVELALTQPWVDEMLVWPEGIQKLCVDSDALKGMNDQPLDVVQGPEDLAYVIYTSGSTGQPKGVMIDHRGAVNTILDINERFGVTSEDRMFAISALNFDLSVYDIFGTLAAGSTIVIPDASARRDAGHWLELMRQERVTFWDSVPALMEMLVEYMEGRAERLPDALRLVFMSGDWIQVTLPDRIKALADGVEVWSGGGATEASIWSILYPIEEVAPAWQSIPYGKPMVNQTFHVLDGALEPRPVWVPGDLYIGGIGLAKGYWRDEEKTETSFITHPRTGERLYRTGDLGRYLPDGNIDFLGREDFQVKIGGHRIELGEIEAALTQHPAVRTGVVSAVGERRGHKRLVAYVIAEDGQDLTVTDLRTFLKERLPEYMVPSAFAFLEAFPLTPNSKVDRRALPAPEQDRSELGKEFVAPRTPIERRLAAIFSQVLNVERVGVNDDFFELGGHSLIATQFISRLNDTFQVSFPIRTIFERPTIAELTELMVVSQLERVESDVLEDVLAEIEGLLDDEAALLLLEDDVVV